MTPMVVNQRLKWLKCISTLVIWWRRNDGPNDRRRTRENYNVVDVARRSEKSAQTLQYSLQLVSENTFHVNMKLQITNRLNKRKFSNDKIVIIDNKHVREREREVLNYFMFFFCVRRHEDNWNGREKHTHRHIWQANERFADTLNYHVVCVHSCIIESSSDE